MSYVAGKGIHCNIFMCSVVYLCKDKGGLIPVPNIHLILWVDWTLGRLFIYMFRHQSTLSPGICALGFAF